ncbi:unnamed protein product [Rhizophagus irregularis]|nr:unnamed protein product [Rhizophagus irregularis]
MGKDIENAIQDIRGTSVAQLVPNRDRDFEGCILARSIPNLGPWTIFTPTELEKLQKREIEKPNPNISTPTISHSNWEVLLPNSEHIRPERLTKQVLVKKLQSRGIVLNGKENKEELVINLEKELNKEMECKKSGEINCNN